MPRRMETDRWLFLVTVALCLLGAVMVFSASAVTAREQYGNGYHFLLRQLLWLALGLAGMFAMMQTDYRRLREPKFVFAFLGVVLVMLAGIFLLDKSHATHRWIRIGPASLQPSELAKLAVILYLAWFLDLRGRPRSFGVNDFRHTIVPATGVVLVMVGLIVVEPDLGTALEILVITLAMLFVAGLSGKYILAPARRPRPPFTLPSSTFPIATSASWPSCIPTPIPRAAAFSLSSRSSPWAREALPA